MSNVTTTDIVAINNSSTVSTINNNTHTLRDEFDKVVYKDGHEALTGNLDANSKRILNLPHATNGSEPVTLSQITELVNLSTAEGALAAEILTRASQDGMLTERIDNLVVPNRTTLSTIASPAAGDAVLLTEAGREGVFIWRTSNLSANVTADPAQGIYVAPSTDTTGATGAWVRSYIGPVNIRWFGALNDGLQASNTANSNALNAFNTWARIQSGRVEACASPGTYYWDVNVAPRWACGISKLHFKGAGIDATTFINTYTTGTAYPWSLSGDPLLFTNTSNPKINTALSGATSITVSTPAESTQFAVGEYVLVLALNIQYNGYPPNHYCFDFVKITAIDHTTGVITFAGDKLSYDYLSTYPEYYTGTHPGGAARVCKLDRNGNTWDVDHTFEGFTCKNINDTGTTYQTATGRKLTFVGVNTAGFSESICEEFLAERCTERLHIEPDKLVKQSTRRDCDLQTTVSLQSSSIDLFTFENCKAPLFTIGGKTLDVSNCTIDQISYGGNYGFNESTLFDSCRIRTVSNILAPYVNTGTRLNYVDGSNVKYANGVFTILKNNVSGLANGGGLANWNVIPGQPLNFCRGTVGTSQASSHFSSDIGTGFVTDIRDIGGAIEIETTLSYASVPAWASGQVWIKRRNAPVLRNCTGCDEVRVASEAERKGKGFGEYFSYTFAPTNKAGRSSQSINMFTRSGKLKRIYMNVVKPMTGTAGAAAQFSDLNTFTASTMATPVTYQILLDLTVAGEREFTLSGLTGKTGNDAVTYDAVAQTALKADAWCETGFQGLFYNFAPSAKNLADLPIFVVVFEFDVGFFGQRITTKTDGTNHLVGIAGTIA